MDDLRHLYGGVLGEDAMRYIQACMECAVASAIVDHLDATNKVLKEMRMEVA
jgi:hypothetical protein